MPISKLRDIINADTNISVDNIQKLPVTPKLPARDLQKEFDKNVDNLIEAIDGQNGLINSITDYVADVASSIVDPSGTETIMTKAVYDTGESPSLNPNSVDRARYADSVQTSVNNGVLYLGVTPSE